MSNINTLFTWLDRDNDGFVTPDDFILGVSLIMFKDANIKEVENVYARYDPFRTGKINSQQLILAIVNGMLDETFRDETLRETFIGNIS